MKNSKRRDRDESATVDAVSKRRSKRGKQEPKPMDLPNPLVVDADEFGAVVDKMLNTGPVTLNEVVKKNRTERRKNPEKDPRYLPVFDFSKKRD
jgi:hypothetical protein